MPVRDQGLTSTKLPVKISFANLEEWNFFRSELAEVDVLLDLSVWDKEFTVLVSGDGVSVAKGEFE